MKALLAKLKDRAAELRRDDPTRFRFLVGAALVALAIAVVLLSVDAPWEGDTGKRVAAGKKLRVTDYAHICSWWAALANLGILVGLLVTSQWWWPWAKTTASEPTAPKPSRSRSTARLLTWLGLAAALAVALWIRVPQMNRYLMLDEQDNLRRSIYGYAELDKESGEPVFVDATWTHAFFENRLANNPVLMSVAAKASLTAWQKVSGKGKLWFSRPALRLPSLVGGALSIVAFWWFLNLLGMPLAAVLAAFVLALHPYHIDYSIQARGYGMMFLFIGTACCSALLAVRTGRWRWFAGLGLSLALVLGSYSGATYFVAVFGAALAVWLGWCGFVRAESRSRALLVRLAVAGALSGGLYAQLIAPSYPQIKAWMLPSEEDGEGFSRAELPPQWVPDAYTQYTTGAWFGGDPEALGRALRDDRSYALLILAVIPVFALLGFSLVWRRGGIARAILLGGCLAPVFAYRVHVYSGIWLHGWYFLYFLPFFAIMLGSGLAGFSLLLHRRIPRIGPALAAILPTLFFIYFWSEVRPGKPGRRALQSFTHDDHTGENFTVFQRGPFNWVVYEEGRMIRQPLGLEIPEEFPYDEAAIEIVVKP